MTDRSHSQIDLLAEQHHRPWPVPKKPWIMEQVWQDLLFMHWAIPPDSIRPLIPQQLELDTFAQFAWVSITPFHMTLRLRGFPWFPGMTDIAEMNCRTYVVADGKRGVFFFSLDAASRVAVWGARGLYHLPYFYARMAIRKTGDLILYSSTRGAARWRGEYHPESSVRHAAPGSIDYFLAERYCLFTVCNRHVYRGDIHHRSWPLQDACVRIAENTVAHSAGIPLAGAPDRVSFARELQVLIWPLSPVGY